MILAFSYRDEPANIIVPTRSPSARVDWFAGDEACDPADRENVEVEVQRRQSRRGDRRLRRRFHAALRDVHGTARCRQALADVRRCRCQPFPQPGLAHRRDRRGCPERADPRHGAGAGDRAPACTRPSDRSARISKRCGSIRRSPSSWNCRTRLIALERKPRPVVETFVLLLAPFAPHLGRGTVERARARDSLAHAPWPSFDPHWRRTNVASMRSRSMANCDIRLLPLPAFGCRSRSYGQG